MLENIVVELTKKLKYVKTLSTQTENKITRVVDKGIYVETDSSRRKFQNSEKPEPSVYISFEYLIDGWKEFLKFKNKNVEANDFTKARGRSSFLMALFSCLPFVEISRVDNVSLRIKKIYTDDLPSESYQNVITFLSEVDKGKYDPEKLNSQITDSNLERVKSACRQDARLLGLINENNQLNKYVFDEYINAENKDQFIRGILVNLKYFRIALICLDLLRKYTKKEKKAFLEELGMHIVYNSTGTNQMVETVAKKRTHNLLKWLETTKLIDQDWSPTENFFDTFSKKEQQEMSNIRNSLLKVMKEYLDAKTKGFGGNPLGSYVRNDFPHEIYQLSFIDSSKYIVTGSVGVGNWASVPWLAIMNRKITVSTQKGYYLTYLFSEDMNSVYLTFMQGVTETTKEQMQQTKVEIRETIPPTSKVNTDNEINLGTSTKAKQYALSTAAYILYQINNIPNENQLVEDLHEMLRIYENYISFKNGYTLSQESSMNGMYVTEKETITIKDNELIDHIFSYIQSKGFFYRKEEVINLYLSLKTKPFVILSGISGTGKTKMVQWFAESVGATEENSQFSLIPIRPDWNDGSDLLGYVDIKGEFKEGPLTKVIKKAINQPELPFFVLLDEMNLARVEYYFSDILSVMESRKWKNGEIVSSNLLYDGTTGLDLKLPNNLYIIGTVNMDETTHPFSKKVLDRANTIEFNRVDLGNLTFLNALEEVLPLKIDQETFASKYLHLKDLYQKNSALVERLTNELVKINQALQLTNAHVGYRVRDEICFYMSYNEEEQLMSEQEAFDNCILQKILPRISGSDSRVDQLLRELYVLFTNKQYEEEGDLTALDLKSATYPLSAAKVAEMMRRLREDGFTSFWVS